MDARSGAEQLELAALVDFYSAGRVPGMVVERLGEAALLLAPGGPPLLCNRLLGLGRGGAPWREALEAATAVADLTGMAWAVPLAHDADPELARELARRDFSEGYAWMQFSRPATRVPRPVTTLDVRIASPADGDAFAGVAAEAFELGSGLAHALRGLPGRPGWRCFLAWDRHRPVACGASYLHQGRAWLGVGATLLSHRRWGAHTALLAARIADALEHGVSTLHVETGKRRVGKPDQAYRNLLRAGFRELGARRNLLCPDFDRRARALARSSESARAQIG